MSLVMDVGDYIVTQGLAASVMRGYLQDTPDNAVAVQDTPGLPPEFTHSHGRLPAREQPSFQITVRRAKGTGSYTAAELLARQIRDALTLVNTTINGTLYLSITPQHEPFSLERDENDRVRFICNYQVLRESVHV